MKFLGLFLLVVGLVGKAQGQKAPVLSPDETAVRATVSACVRSWNNHNYSDLATYTTPDVDWVTNVGMWWQGRAAVRQALQAYHEGMFKNTLLRSEQVSVRFAAPTVAVVHQVVYIGRYYPPDGVDQEYNRQGDNQAMITYTVLKQQEKWLISTAQVSDINQAAAAYNPVKQ
ncbi:SgcJ/EcaC family oxidoreductase [Hymenobacter rubidus]|uniref:SgcJ/EcaC family oxidoreductase n=1 Tax=Hymenobacter rubidus TaxID=1441626 RepID=UPI00191FA8BE|nr:SgcJ/EcaC family oxidoreductase [Hymenobacter rubidus]